MILTAINQLWRADITYIRLRDEFVFLAVILDAYSRRIIGWALDRSMEDLLTLTALRMALARRAVEPGLVSVLDLLVDGAVRSRACSIRASFDSLARHALEEIDLQGLLPDFALQFGNLALHRPTACRAQGTHDPRRRGIPAAYDAVRWGSLHRLAPPRPSKLPFPDGARRQFEPLVNLLEKRHDFIPISKTLTLKAPPRRS